MPRLDSPLRAPRGPKNPKNPRKWSGSPTEWLMLSKFARPAGLPWPGRAEIDSPLGAVL